MQTQYLGPRIWAWLTAYFSIGFGMLYLQHNPKPEYSWLPWLLIFGAVVWILAGSTQEHVVRASLAAAIVLNIPAFAFSLAFNPGATLSSAVSIAAAGTIAFFGLKLNRIWKVFFGVIFVLGICGCYVFWWT